ncbi:hypothetical protein LUZ60_008154 [Juncus effusus]|nr:hypothetical protein LUZ60_008154 [Juncus effusus]
MAWKSATNFLLILALVILGFSAITSESRHLRRINRRSIFDPVAICKHAVHYSKICEEVASASPHVTSPVGLIEASLDAAIVKAQKARVEVSSLMKAKGKDYPGIKGSTLSACYDNYDLAVDALRNSQNLVKTGGNHADLMTELSAAGTMVTTCQDGIDEVPEMSNPIGSLHINLDHHVSNCLNLGANLLH